MTIPPKNVEKAVKFVRPSRAVKASRDLVKDYDQVYLNKIAPNFFDIIAGYSEKALAYNFTGLVTFVGFDFSIRDWVVRTTKGTIVCTPDTLFYLVVEIEDNLQTFYRPPAQTVKGISID